MMNAQEETTEEEGKTLSSSNEEKSAKSAKKRKLQEIGPSEITGEEEPTGGEAPLCVETGGENNESNYKLKKKKKRKILSLFNNIFSWVVSKNAKIPSKEIETKEEVKFLNFNNILSKHFGSKVLFVTDESISKSENIMIEDKVGWVTRRRRDVGHEWLILKLKYPSVIYGMEINFENMEDDICPHLSIEVVENSCIDEIVKEEEYIMNETEEKEGAEQREQKIAKRKSYNFLESYKIDKSISDILENQNTPWVELLQADCVDFLKCFQKKKIYYFQVNDASLIKPWTHIRINLYPDGGINKIKFYGEFVTLFKKHTILSKQKIFLNKPENGCTLIYYHCDDIHKGHPKNMIDSYKTDGFSTKRLSNRPPIILRTLTYNSIKNVSIFKFGVRGVIENFTFDIGNYKYDHPEYIHIYLLDCVDMLTLDLLEQKRIFEEDEKLEKKKIDWLQLPPCKLANDQKKTFYNFNLLEYNFTIMERTATHFKISLHPDGGISQVNVIGTVLSTPQ
ncbi:allantoicase, putative [Plasmodium vivax]|uniref:Allantoate amidinohydrolase, putative n=6 Tax=Plasmodium vivax TaxID=5855 RepID=A5K405_PLAVS|nr:allantoate amidinohydrolase, putative [Plasmodium vivax]KMZ78961.1 allantoate amidinohydrolase [Plasmodium vivax India VII]KMZ87166.1 allantoate amidinohydrolase [Plasmodium vivax Brazil I]KMZ91804.1 allantoate amidinohydrolase [Plasmodium vivax Mauritania I]KMZ97706.1 allantoate amidinohydrolase [Plasmodium vivax North Korean]EDL46259.1 allantoate amidinohydrolase, putative [Plasmodium vivax]|eukprot:XP_001615986.1 allantoate amidinohydrolase [Plasmodium vivax Sal-1]